MRLFSPCARITPARSLLSFVLVALIPCAAAADSRPLGFAEALQIAEQRSARISAQEAAVGAAAEQAARARELPDPKLRFGIDNLPVSRPDAFSFTRDFM